MPETVQHQDFGEKIGGAKKDLWNERGLYSYDLSAMNERETEKYVKKDNVWKKNDYQSMIDGGTPFDVVYFIKTVRDSLPAVPVFLRKDDTEEKRLEHQKQYIDTVRYNFEALKAEYTSAKEMQNETKQEDEFDEEI